MASSLGVVLGTRWARVVLVFTLAEGIFLLGSMTYILAYLHTRFGLSLSAAAALAALYAVGGLVYALTARHILPRLGEPRMVLVGGLLMGAGFLAWWQLPHWGFAGPAALLVGFGTYLYHSTLQTQATQMAPTARGTAVALFAFSLFTGQALGVQLAGIVVDSTGYAPLLAVAALALPLAGWGLAAAMRRQATANG